MGIWSKHIILEVKKDEALRLAPHCRYKLPREYPEDARGHAALDKAWRSVRVISLDRLCTSHNPMASSKITANPATASPAPHAGHEPVDMLSSRLPALLGASLKLQPRLPHLHNAFSLTSLLHGSASPEALTDNLPDSIALQDGVSLRRPTEPEPYECCGRGCEYCVWTLYWEELKEYQREVAKVQGLAVKEKDPFEEFEKRLRGG